MTINSGFGWYPAYQSGGPRRMWPLGNVGTTTAQNGYQENLFLGYWHVFEDLSFANDGTGGTISGGCLEKFLYQQRFPRPPEIVGGIEDYLNFVADDAKIHPSVRVKAAGELGVLSGLRVSGNIMGAIQIGMAYEKALQQYERRFPPRQPALEDEGY